MISNKHLIEEVHKDFEKIFHTMTYRQALSKFRQIHNVLKNSKTKKYDGKGEVGPTSNTQNNTQNHVGNVFNPICFKCGTTVHFLHHCKVMIMPCIFLNCNSTSHNAGGYQAMLDKGRKVITGRLAAVVMEAGKPATLASGSATGAPTVPPSDAQLIALEKRPRRKNWITWSAVQPLTLTLDQPPMAPVVPAMVGANNVSVTPAVNYYNTNAASISESDQSRCPACMHAKSSFSRGDYCQSNCIYQ